MHSKVKNDIKGHTPHSKGKFELLKWCRILCTDTGSAFFGPSIWPLLPKVSELGPKKKALPVPVQKSETTFIIQTFPKNEDYGL